MKNQASRAIGAIGQRDAERDIYRSKQADKRARKFQHTSSPTWEFKNTKRQGQSK